jgi:hypothetical protein
MKIDIDTIFYIILSIIILVVSGLGSRRRKQAQQMKTVAPSSARPVALDPEEKKISQPRQPALDPFERLEQILTGQSQYETMEGESLEVLEDEEQTIIDEEEEYLAEPVPQQKAHPPDLAYETGDEQGKKSLGGLFRDVDEITRAVIYSEILPRKYF